MSIIIFNLWITDHLRYLLTRTEIFCILKLGGVFIVLFMSSICVVCNISIMDVSENAGMSLMN